MTGGTGYSQFEKEKTMEICDSCFQASEGLISRTELFQKTGSEING